MAIRITDDMAVLEIGNCVAAIARFSEHVKLADSLGDSGWVCLMHAEQVLVTVPGAFIASHDAGASPRSWSAAARS
jgi:hypothetical protein